ncbi:MAG TPA: hypothetical protein VFV49_16650 [Thermoanaerobaculia bacterium]|nr:hypothetical protein [Thermoanaerobaculia bacterium]
MASSTQGQDTSARTDGHPSIWLEVSNVKVQGSTFEVQLRADREPERTRWWAAPPAADAGAAAAQFKAVSEALEKKRPVLAQVVAGGAGLVVTSLAIQYTETIR